MASRFRQLSFILGKGTFLFLGLLIVGGADAWAAPITHQVTIQPIQLCDDTATTCAQVEYYEDVTDKIWAQAGIDVEFLPITQLTDSILLEVDNEVELETLLFGQFDWTTGDSLVPDGVITMFFAEELNYMAGDGGGILYGHMFGIANYAKTAGIESILINSSEVVAFAGGDGRQDTVAHEIGHALGLIGHGLPGALGSGAATDLMADGTVRAIPTGGVGDVTPDGLNLSQLNADQIAYVQTVGHAFEPVLGDINFEPVSYLTAIDDEIPPVIPEPGSFLLFAAGFVAVSSAARRRA